MVAVVEKERRVKGREEKDEESHIFLCFFLNSEGFLFQDTRL